ncbi:MAG TPA: RimK/LysX family protein [Nevskia sp.]|nr:RimK/LysX family protein [Nevskia sp.]
MHIRLTAILAGLLAASAAQAQTPAPATPAAAPAAAPAAPAVVAAPHVYAHLERAQVKSSPSIEIQAQLDGGGNITVLQAEEIKYAHGEGGMFVHFTIDNGRVGTGRTVNVALPVIQDQHIRDRSGAIDHRPIVAMSFCIGDHAFTTNVALQVRDNYNPPLLLGKADAAQFGTLDPQKKNTIEPGCSDAAQ